MFHFSHLTFIEENLSQQLHLSREHLTSPVKSHYLQLRIIYENRSAVLCFMIFSPMSFVHTAIIVIGEEIVSH